MPSTILLLYVVTECMTTAVRHLNVENIRNGMRRGKGDQENFGKGIAMYSNSVSIKSVKAMYHYAAMKW